MTEREKTYASIEKYKAWINEKQAMIDELYEEIETYKIAIGECRGYLRELNEIDGEVC